MTGRLSRPLRQVGEEGDGSGGVFDQGTPAEDGPGTWEALASPRAHPGFAESRWSAPLWIAWE